MDLNRVLLGDEGAEYALDRSSEAYKQWKEAVKERDERMCQRCGTKSFLIVHHKESFADDEEGRFDISNGETLCTNCHKAEHGIKNEDLLETTFKHQKINLNLLMEE